MTKYPDIDFEIIQETVSYVRDQNKPYLWYDGSLNKTRHEAKRQLWGRLRVNLVLVTWKAKMSDPEFAKSYKPRKQQFIAKTPREREFVDFYDKNCISRYPQRSKAINHVLKNFKRIDVDLHGTDYTNEAEFVVSKTVEIVWKNVNKITKSVRAYFWHILGEETKRYADDLKEERKVLEYCSPHSYRITREDVVPKEEEEDHQARDVYLRNTPTYESADKITDYHWKIQKAKEEGKKLPEEPDMIDERKDIAPVTQEEWNLPFKEYTLKPNADNVDSINKTVIHNAIAKLPRIQRKVIQLYELGEYTQKETAKKLGISQQKVSYHYKKAIATLKQTIDPYEAGYKQIWKDFLYDWE